MSRYKTVTNLLACLILVVATLRAATFWAADPMLAYANSYDQMRTLKPFGLYLKGSSYPPYLGPVEQPWRYFIKADEQHAPTHPSSDLLFKALQIGVMTMFRTSDGVMDIKNAAAPLLIGWLLGIWLIFRKLTAKPLAALGFAVWILWVADPINLMFLNTWYAEFSALVLTTLFVGIVWMWLFELVSQRRALLWGAVCLALISFNRNQYMFLLPSVALLVAVALILSRPRSTRLAASWAQWALIATACMLPTLAYNAAAKKHMYVETATNRVDTVFVALLPASKNPDRMLERLGLPPECMQFMGESLYTRPIPEFETHCPKSMRLPLLSIAKAVALEPGCLATIIWNIAQHHKGFLQHHVGHVEGADYVYIDTSDGIRPYHQSINPLIQGLSARAAVLLIYFAALGPVLTTLAAWALKQGRWAFMFLLNGLLFNYALFSSILGDGYMELERHAILCFNSGALFLVLLVIFAMQHKKPSVSGHPSDLRD